MGAAFLRPFHPFPQGDWQAYRNRRNFKSAMEVICLEEPAFYDLIEKVVARLRPQEDAVLDEWVPPSEAMRLLNVKSDTTMQSLRDNGKVKFSQPSKKIILYSRSSINDYLEAHAQKTF